MFNIFKKAEQMVVEKKMVTLKKFRPIFTTVDGNNHIGCEYKYGIVERLLCTIPEYIMIDIKSDGYIKDNRNVMYPLTNIVSIDWTLEDEKVVEDRFSEWTVFVSEEVTHGNN